VTSACTRTACRSCLPFPLTYRRRQERRCCSLMLSIKEVFRFVTAITSIFCKRSLRSRFQRQRNSCSLLHALMSKGHPSACVSFKPPQLIPLLPIAFLLLFSASVIAESTFYSVNVLKTFLSSSPDAHIEIPDNFDLLSPEAVLPAFDPLSCTCGSNDVNGLVDGPRTCNPPPSPPLFNQTAAPNSSSVC
jgi:hypothetical protein